MLQQAVTYITGKKFHHWYEEIIAGEKHRTCSVCQEHQVLDSDWDDRGCGWLTMNREDNS